MGGSDKKKKILMSRGGVAPGGLGFKCPKAGCDKHFDTAQEALDHGAAECGVEFEGQGGRDIGEDGRTPCLWGGCGKMLKLSQHKGGNWDLLDIRRHEALHEKGAPPRGFVCPECDAFASDEMAAVSAHMEEEHEVEWDGKTCCWDGCGKSFSRLGEYKRHECVHTGKFPFCCPEASCKKGFVEAGAPLPITLPSPMSLFLRCAFPPLFLYVRSLGARLLQGYGEVQVRLEGQGA